MNPLLGTLKPIPATENPQLMAPSIVPKVTSEVSVVSIDASFSDTAAFCENYKTSPSITANCVIVEAKREGNVFYAASVALATTRVDVNKVVKKHLNASRISFAPMETAVSLTAMEYGAISPLGLPVSWPVLVDAKVAASEVLVIGSGIRPTKLILSGKTLVELSKATVIENLAKEHETRNEI